MVEISTQINPGREHMDDTYRSLRPVAERCFEFFVLVTGKLKEGQEIINILVPKNEFGLRNHPYKLFLASESTNAYGGG